MNATTGLAGRTIIRWAARATALLVLAGVLFALSTAFSSADPGPPPQPAQAPGESVGGFASAQNGQAQAVPAKPTSVTLTSPGASGKLKATWTIGASDNPTQYTIQIQRNGWFQDATTKQWEWKWGVEDYGRVIAESDTTKDGRKRSVTLSDLTDCASYGIFVKTTNTTGDGPWSDFAGALLQPTAACPGAPTGVTLEAHDELGKLQVKWTAPSGTITGYEIRHVYYGCEYVNNGWDCGDKGETRVQNISATNTTLSKLSNGVTYKIKVRAKNSTGWGSWSSEQSRAVTPKPNSVGVGNAGSGTLEVSWSYLPPYPNADPAPEKLEIERVAYCNGERNGETCVNPPPSNASWGNRKTIAGKASGEATITGLTNDTNYWVRVRAKWGSYYSNWQVSGSGAKPQRLPDQLSKPELLPGPEPGELRVSWSVSENQSLTNYKIVYKTCSGSCPAAVPDGNDTKLVGLDWVVTNELTKTLVSIDGSNTNMGYTLTALTDGSTYAVAVLAKNANGWGATWSPIASQTLVPVLESVTTEIDSGAAANQKLVYKVTFSQAVTVDYGSDDTKKPYIPLREAGDGVLCPDPRTDVYSGFKATYVSGSNTRTLTFKGPSMNGDKALGDMGCIHLKTGTNTLPTIQNSFGQTALSHRGLMTSVASGTPKYVASDRALELSTVARHERRTYVETYQHSTPGFAQLDNIPTSKMEQEFEITVHDWSDDFAANESVSVSNNTFTVDWNCKYENDTAKRWNGTSWVAVTDSSDTCSAATAFNTGKSFTIKWTNPPESGGDTRWVDFYIGGTAESAVPPHHDLRVTYSFLRSARLLAQDRAELEASVCRSDVAPVDPDSPGPVTLKIPTTERTCVIRCERDAGEGHLPCGNITFNANIFNVFNHLDSTIKDRAVGVYAVPNQTWGYAHRETSYQPWYNGRTAFTIGNHRYTTPWLSPVYGLSLYAVYERKDAEEWPDAPNRSRRISGQLSQAVNVCLPSPQGEGIPLIARYNGKYNPDDDGNYAADADLMSPFDADSDIYGDSSLYVPYWELMRGQPTASSQLICAQVSDFDFGPGSLYTTSLAGEVAAAISPVDEQGDATWMGSVPIKASEFLAALPNYGGVIYYNAGAAQSYGVLSSTIGDSILISEVGDFEIPPGATLNLISTPPDFTIAGTDSSPETPPMPGG